MCTVCTVAGPPAKSPAQVEPVSRGCTSTVESTLPSQEIFYFPSERVNGFYIQRHLLDVFVLLFQTSLETRVKCLSTGSNVSIVAAAVLSSVSVGIASKS